MHNYDWVDENCLKKAKLKDLKDYNFNIAFDLDDEIIEEFTERLLEFDNSYNVEINKSILNPKKHGFFKPKEESIYDIMKDNLGFNDTDMYNFGLIELRELDLENLLYRQPKSLSTKQKLALSMVIDACKNKKYYLITDEMFINNKNFCNMVSWLLKRVENNNGSIVWLTTKNIDEVDDVCDEGIKYPSNTCFYFRDEYGFLMKTDQKRKQQSFKIEYKEDNFVLDKKDYKGTMSIDVKDCTPQKLTYLKYYLKKYDLDVIDLFLTKSNGKLWLKIGLTGKDSLLAIYDIILFLKVADMCSDQSFDYFAKDFSFIDLVYVETESPKIVFVNPDTEEILFFKEDKVPFNSKELEDILCFTAVKLKGEYVGLYEEFNNNWKARNISDEYYKYKRMREI